MAPFASYGKITITEDADGALRGGRSVLNAEDREAFLDYLQNKRSILVFNVSEDKFQFFGVLKDMIAAYAGGAADDMVGSMARAVSCVCDWLAFPLSGGKVDRHGVPKRAGAPEAAISAADTVEQFDRETHNAHQDPAALRRGAQYVRRGLRLETIGKSLAQRASGCYIPVLRTVYEGVSTVVKVAEPVLATHEALAQTLHVAVQYIKGPRQQAVRNRKKNKTEKAKLVKQTEADALPRARAQVRQEVAGQFEDQVKSFLK